MQNIMITNTDSLVCPICYGTMQRVNQAQSKTGNLVRYRCTCGHYDDIRDERPSIHTRQSASDLPEGFNEL